MVILAGHCLMIALTRCILNPELWCFFFFIAVKSGEVQEGKSHMVGSPFLPGRKESSAIGWSIAQQLWCGCKRGTMTVKAKCWHWSKKYSNNGLTRMKGGKTDVMFHQYRLCKNNLYRRRWVMRQQAIPSSATVAVQRHQVKRCSPNLAWTRAHASSDKEQSMSDRVWEGASAMFLLGGIYFECNAKFSARDISSTFFNSWFTRELLQLSFSQAARRVMLSIHTCILAFLIEGKKELKALY